MWSNSQIQIWSRLLKISLKENVIFVQWLSHSLLKRWKVWQHENISKLKILTFAFSYILDAAKLLGTTVTPQSIYHLMQIWAALLRYFSAISAIFGSSSKTGSLGFAQALSGELNGLFPVTENTETWFWET